MLQEITERFMRYVQIDTQSDPHSETFPTTEKQKNLSALLARELREMGIVDAEMDPFGYVYATIPSNSSKKTPVLCFCAHVDTAPDCSGTNVKPLLHSNYNGNPIILPDDKSQILSSTNHPGLAQKIGHHIITASGTTLLGSDDKSGVAIIMQAAQELMKNPSLPHGTIRILFTPDEEVGKGTDKIDMQKLGADFGYTLDGGGVGLVEDENFSADSVHIVIEGVPAHPGYAKGKMQNAIKALTMFVGKLPKDYLSPETTENREGFVHPVFINGNLEKAELKLIIRDFNVKKLLESETYLKKLLDETMTQFLQSRYSFTINEQYRNMKEVLDKHPNVVEFAMEAVKRAGIEPKKNPIRGGTDGARLSFMGLPCPNISAGEQAIHSVQEWVSVQDMVKATEIVIHLCQIWDENS